MDNLEIKQKLQAMLEDLDIIQETDYAQSCDAEDQNSFMWQIGEAIGCINNALDELDKDDKGAEQFVGRRCLFNGWNPEDGGEDELMEQHRNEVCEITSVEIDDGYDSLGFEGCYFNVKFENGDEIYGVSGYDTIELLDE